MKKVKTEDEQISELASLINDKEEMTPIREEERAFVELKENKKTPEDGYGDEMKRRTAYRLYLYETIQRIDQE